MKILHYSLGLPPYRSGGLTKLCCDLIVEQKKMGHEVVLLWPGRMKRTTYKYSMIKHIDKVYGINYELVNPLPVPLDEGICNPQKFMCGVDGNVYSKFLGRIAPDIIHVHSLMGIHREFFEEAKKMGIRIIFTAHDYYGICSKVNLFNNGICRDYNCVNCAACNQNALSLMKIYILQSVLYRKMKDSKRIRQLRKIHKSSYEKKKLKYGIEKIENRQNEYIALRDYYKSIICKFDKIHFSSQQVMKIYDEFCSYTSGSIVPITHSQIKNNIRKREYKKKTTRFLYLGQEKDYKGFFWMIKQFDKVYKKNKNIELHIFCPNYVQRDYLAVHQAYDHSCLESVFEMGDIVVVPSLCAETFGYIVIEALSYGVPVLASENVGAKDLIQNYGQIFEVNENDGLYNVIMTLTNEKMKMWNDNLFNGFTPMDIGAFSTMMMGLYLEQN